MRLAVIVIIFGCAVHWAAQSDPVREWQRTQVERHTCHLAVLSANEESIDNRCVLEGP